MNGVIGMAELMMTSGLTDRQIQYTGTILKSGNALLTIINDILDFSKIEAGRMELVHVDFNLTALLEETLDFFSELSQRKNIELISFINPHYLIDINGDPDRLRQIIMNLVSNAVKFTSKGEVILFADVSNVDDQGQIKLDVEVQDTGIGIEKHILSKIFAPFTQADDSTTRMFGGSGLGLTISKELIGLMNGQISAESEPNVGSKFRFSVMLNQSIDGAQAISDPRKPLSEMSVMVANQNQQMKNMLCHYLSNWEITCDQSDHVTELPQRLTTAAVEGKPYQMVILDIEYPHIDLESLITEISTNANTKETKLVLLISAHDHKHRKITDNQSIFSVLTKPVRQSVLYNCLTSESKISHLRADDSLKAKYKNIDFSFPYQILLAEDNPVNQSVACGMLDFLGCEVDIKENGNDTVEAYAATPYDLIFMDCQMPGMDGFQATDRIRVIESSPAWGGRRIPIVALTAHAIKGDRERCLSAGMDDYLSKPFEIEELIEILKKWLTPHKDTSRKALDPKDINKPIEVSAALSNESALNFDEIKRNHPSIDTSVLEEIRLINESLVTKIINEYLSHCPKIIAELEQAVEMELASNIQNLAHSLKSSSGNVGAKILFELCHKLEAMGREKSIDSAPVVFKEIKTEFEKVCVVMRNQSKENRWDILD